MSKGLGKIIGCKEKPYSWHLNGFPDGSNIESTVLCGEKLTCCVSGLNHTEYSVIYTWFANPTCGLLDRKISEANLSSSNVFREYDPVTRLEV